MNANFCTHRSTTFTYGILLCTSATRTWQMPKPKRFPGPSYTPPKSAIPKKYYTPKINPYRKKRPEPDLNFGRRNPAKRMAAQQHRYNFSSPTQANAYPLGASNSQVLKQEMNPMQVSTRQVEVDDHAMRSSVIDKIDEGFKAWCKIQTDQVELERIIANTERANSERYHCRFICTVVAAVLIAWIFGATFKAFD
ncbi:hypothetical protein IFR05_001136 [Cadophora sp. M221]|nr:hypothetical protein IFR05_001136 [Cadophora sp. M221]